jgi:fimbrial chaperone protein
VRTAIAATTRVALLVAMAYASNAIAGVSASELALRPTQVHLGRGVSNRTITLQNVGKDPIRIQVTGFAWDQEAFGKLKLTPSDDLIFFPQLLTLQPNESRAVRVGVTVPAGAVEKAYRVYFEELPALAGELQPAIGPAVQLRQKIGVPVFLEPAGGAPKPALAAAQLKDEQLLVNVENSGNMHAALTKVRIVAKDAAGTSLFSDSRNGWYVLANETLTFGFPIPHVTCGKAASFDVEVTLDKSELRQTVSGVRGCTR